MADNKLLGLLQQQATAGKLANVNMLMRPPEPYLRSAAPSLYGFLGGLLGTAPDDMAGSVMDPNTAAVQEGARYGYFAGLPMAVAPLLGGAPRAINAGAAAVGQRLEPGVTKLVNRTMAQGGGLATIYLCGYWKSWHTKCAPTLGLATIYLCGYWKYTMHNP